MFVRRRAEKPSVACRSFEAVALLREAEAHEGVGEFQDAIRCYNRLRRLHPVFANHAGIP